MELIDYIIKKKLRCVIVSPHFDDAVLSCGGLMMQLSGKTDLTVVTVFTGAHTGPYTLSARQYLKASGNKDAVALYNEREKEDKEVLSHLAVKRIDLDLKDALFRRKEHGNVLGKFLPEFKHVYPTYRFHITKNIAKNDHAVSQMRIKLSKIKTDRTLFFAPYGIGNHADHILTRKVSENLFENLILYSDFPYNVRLHTEGTALQNGEVYRLTPDLKKKRELIRGYRTQFHGLFPSGIIPEHQEVYFTRKKI